MNFDQLTSCTLTDRKKDTLLIRGFDGQKACFIKAVSPDRPDMVHALRDEYRAMSPIRDGRLPRYLAYTDRFHMGSEGPFHALCMEYIDGRPLSRLLKTMDLRDFLSLLEETGRLLGYLVLQGVLYTDLNPGNIMVREDGSFCLVDFTGAYFYRLNPNPDYHLRFSYELNPNLAADQLLIQELALMMNAFLMDYEEKKEGRPVPSSVYALLETGLHPSDDLSLSDYLQILSRLLEK